MTSDSVTFCSELVAMRGGGHAVAVAPETAVAIGAKHRSRVRGTFGGVEFRSNLVSMGGGLLLGVHKATVHGAGASIGDAVEVVMQLDDEPLPTDVVPPELEAELRANKAARAAWDRLAPSHRREYVGHLLEAKKPETRVRRAKRSVEQLLDSTKDR
jgi:bacteriocin resistance YdeI/OmpD-like protein/uncharacterized protein DUF1905